MDVEAIAVDSPHGYARNHVQQYLESDGAAVEHPMADALVLLYIKGRKSGQIRRIPIVANRDGGELVVMASAGGSPKDPEWYLNLVADPGVWVRDKAEFYAATASTVTAEDRPAYYARFLESFPAFKAYEEKTERVVPMVRVSRND
jgi:deazaflavin-dependent oxidoreductase (nitroreductase family)